MALMGLIACFAFGGVWWSLPKKETPPPISPSANSPAETLPTPVETPQEEPPKIDGPLLSLDRIRHDFGNLRQKARSVTTFTISNSGTRNLQLGKLKAGCNCIKAVAAKTELAPGEKTEMTVHLVTSLRTGPFHYTLLVHSNDIKSPQTAVELAVNVAAPLIIEPPMLLFGKVKRGHTGVQALKLRSENNQPFKLLGLKNNRGEFSILNEEANADSTAYTLQVGGQPLPDSKAPAGFVLDTLTITSDLDNGSPTWVQLVMQIEEISAVHK